MTSLGTVRGDAAPVAMSCSSASLNRASLARLMAGLHVPDRLAVLRVRRPARLLVHLVRHQHGTPSRAWTAGARRIWEHGRARAFTRSNSAARLEGALQSCASDKRPHPLFSLLFPPPPPSLMSNPFTPFRMRSLPSLPSHPLRPSHPPARTTGPANVLATSRLLHDRAATPRSRRRPSPTLATT